MSQRTGMGNSAVHILLLFLFPFPTIGKTNQKIQDTSNSCTAIPWLQTCAQNGYDKMTPPEYYTGNTTQVQIRLYVESLGNFKATTMDYDMDIYFIEFWKDHRLNHTHHPYLSIRDQVTLDQIWMPDIYFANSKRAQLNYVTVPNCILKINPDGTIRYSVRVHMKIACNMELKTYPLDSQICFLKMLTYGSTQKEVNVTWSPESPVSLNPDIKASDLKVWRVDVEYCNGTYYGLEYSCLKATFYLKRDIGYSLLQVYLPTSFIVAISWISFWLDPCSVPGRVGLAITTLLTLSTQAVGLHYHLPPVGYAKAQDIWFGVCILFLFGALVEFALVNMFLRQSEMAEKEVRKALDPVKRKISRGRTKSVVETVLMKEAEGMEALEHMTKMNGEVSNHRRVSEMTIDQLISGVAKVHRGRAMRTDKISRMAFPIIFFIFCAVYWFSYCLRSGPSGGC